VLAVLALTALGPILLVLVNALKPRQAITRNPLALPTELDLGGFERAWQYGHFATGFPNSLLLTATTVVVVLATAGPAAYVLSRRAIRLVPIAGVYFLMAMTVPIQLFLFPLYAAFARLGLLNNVVAVGVVIAALNLPISILLLRTYFEQIPLEVIEAATVDGASTVSTLWHILLPIVRPGLITVGIIVGLNAWNEYLITSTFLQKQQNLTATLGFLTMNGTFTTDQSAMMAGAAILIVPVAVLFLIGQRFIVDGLVSGSVKG
jgi:raffinose/stachyose/melibiose transport system permease protein